MKFNIPYWVTWKMLVARPSKIFVPVYQFARRPNHKNSLFIRIIVKTLLIRKLTPIFATVLVCNTVLRQITTTRRTYTLYFLSCG